MVFTPFVIQVPMLVNTTQHLNSYLWKDAAFNAIIEDVSAHLVLMGII